MKNGGLILLFILISTIGLSQCSKQQNSQQQNSHENERQLMPFNSGYEYTFKYNAQLSTGLMVGEDTVDSQQTAATRVQMRAHIQFQSQTDATLRLEDIQIGYLNEELDQPEQVQPMGKFESKTIHEDKRNKLQQPVLFKYVDGVVESIQFQNADSTWSKNMKRSVLNMLQLNLKKNNAQQIRDNSGKSSEEEHENEPIYKSFTIPEVNF